jgi:dienelactone hydrolase
MRQRASACAAAASPSAAPAEQTTGPSFHAVAIRDGPATLAADLAVPSRPRAVVLMAHAHGSSRHSPRNRTIAAHFYAAGLAPLLLDLLTRDEEAMDLQTGQWRFDIDLLAERVIAATRWLSRRPKLRTLPVCYFGAGTASAAALVAASQPASAARAVVSFGGRADLASDRLTLVPAPTLLIAGELDEEVIVTSKDVMTELRCEKALRIVPGATHLFETADALADAAGLARDWFLQHLKEGRQTQPGRRGPGHSPPPRSALAGRR